MANNAYVILRRFLGVLEIALYPLVVLAGSFGDNGPEWYYSISASAYTNAAPVFHMIMGGSGLFLIAHGFASRKDYGRVDFAVNALSGVFALLIALFPCAYPGVVFAGVYPLPIQASALIHNISAAAFFGLRAFNILFLFTKTAGSPTPEKLTRNLVYRICGIGIYGFMAFQVVTSFILALALPATMMNEIGMTVLDGVSWLVKSEAWFKDKISQAKLREQA